jgi:hypothetical protein
MAPPLAADIVVTLEGPRMRPNLVVAALRFTLVSSALTGCTNTGLVSSAPQNTRPLTQIPAALQSFIGSGHRAGLKLVDAAKIKAQLYVSQFATKAVNDYSAPNRGNAAPFCEITGTNFVNSLGVDSSGTVWIPQGNPIKITSNGANCGPAGPTLTDPNGQPVDIAFDSQGTRYVADIQNNSSGPGDISVYPPGYTSPTRTLTGSFVFAVIGVAVDSRDNVYMSFVDEKNHGSVIEFPQGQMPGKNLTEVHAGLTPGTVGFDRHDNLIIQDQGTRMTKIYAPPYTGKHRKIALKGYTVQCSLNKRETALACADYENATVDVFRYPSGKYLYSFNNGISASGELIGLAYDPAGPN